VGHLLALAGSRVQGDDLRRVVPVSTYGSTRATHPVPLKPFASPQSHVFRWRGSPSGGPLHAPTPSRAKLRAK